MTAYYNEFDKNAAQWLRELIAEGHIAPGDVDERDIQDVLPSDLAGYTQCHFFAGIGIWSYALRQAGWADDRPVWTGSCPCQPFSAAGKGAAFDDERHLWPAFHHLIEQRRPPVVFGEQVASKDGLAWLDLVHADLEGTGYAVGAVDLCAAGVGAPHIRQRLYWVADSDKQFGGQGCSDLRGRTGGSAARSRAGLGGGGVSYGMGHSSDQGLAQRVSLSGVSSGASGTDSREAAQRAGVHVGGLDNSVGDGRGARRNDDAEHDGQQLDTTVDANRPGPTNGFWRAADWLGCRDGKWRPVSPKPQPLVDGSSESLGRVRAESVEKIERSLNAWAVENKVELAESLRNLYQNLGEKPHSFWSAGRLPRLHEAPFLLAFLRQLAQQGGRVSQCLSFSCEEVGEVEVRGVRVGNGASGAPHRCGLEEQRHGKHSDALSSLSSLLAHHAHTAWGKAYEAHAEIGFPLAHGAAGRVVKLRGYGNAVNAKAAETFVSAYLECRA